MRSLCPGLVAAVLASGVAACGTLLSTSDEVPAPADGGADAASASDGAVSPDAQRGSVTECELKRPGTPCPLGLCFPDGECRPPLSADAPCEASWQCGDGAGCEPIGADAGEPPRGTCKAKRSCALPSDPTPSCPCCLGAACVRLGGALLGACVVCAFDSEPCVVRPLTGGTPCCEGYRCNAATRTCEPGSATE